MKKLGWIVAIAWWLYFLTAVFLYIHFGFKWVNTVDVLLTSALLIAFSVWYVIEKFWSGPGKSRWVLGWNGGLYRRKSHECWGSGYPRWFRRFAEDEPEETSEKRPLHKSRDHTS
jgi:membrane protease YdiL (CAAX protease family)